MKTSLISGWSLCPADLLANGECLQNTTWSASTSLTTMLDMSSLTTTTVYSPQNGTILSVFPNLESQRSVPIPASLVSSIFDYGLNGTNSDGVRFIASAINYTSSIEEKSSQLRIVRGVLSVAIMDWAVEPEPTPGPMPITAYFALLDYRINVSPVSRVVFMCLCFATIVWCFLVIFYCWFFGSPSPNTSRYPEIDFTAKVMVDGMTGSSWLSGLGNTTTRAVSKQIKGKVLFVGSMPTDKGVDRVAIGTVPELKTLRFGQSYL